LLIAWLRGRKLQGKDRMGVSVDLSLPTLFMCSMSGDEIWMVQSISVGVFGAKCLNDLNGCFAVRGGKIPAV